jgi:hypothetical protein
MLIVVILSVAFKHIMLSVVMLNVVILNVVALRQGVDEKTCWFKQQMVANLLTISMIKYFKGLESGKSLCLKHFLRSKHLSKIFAT